MTIFHRTIRALSTLAAGLANHLHAILFGHMARAGLVVCVVPTGAEAVQAELARIRLSVQSATGETRREALQHIGEIQARLLSLEQRSSRQGTSSGSDEWMLGQSESLGTQIESAFKADADLFAKTRRVSFDVQAALNSPATGGHGSRDLATTPGANMTSLSALLEPGPLESLATLHYPRRTSVVGAAAVQTAEGDVKATAEPVFTAISTNTATVAGLCVASEQALATSGGLSRAIDGHLQRSIRTAIDDLLVSGTAVAAWPFPGFVAIAGAAFVGPATFTSLVDGLLAGALRMRTRGFNPQICVLNEAAFLGVMLAKDLNERPLTDRYLADLVLALGGMKVALSAGVAANSGLLIDPAFAGWLSSGSIRVQVGWQADQFARNLLTIRAEIQVLPWASDFEALMMAQPAAA